MMLMFDIERRRKETARLPFQRDRFFTRFAPKLRGASAAEYEHLLLIHVPYRLQTLACGISAIKTPTKPCEPSKWQYAAGPPNRSQYFSGAVLRSSMP